jgi:hypothetical protein
VVAPHGDHHRAGAREQLHGPGVRRRLHDHPVPAAHERGGDELDRALRAGRDHDLPVGRRRAAGGEALGDRRAQRWQAERRVAADGRARRDGLARAAGQRRRVLVVPGGAEREVDEVVLVGDRAAEEGRAQRPRTARRHARREPRAAALAARDDAAVGELRVGGDDRAAADLRELREGALGRQARAVLELLAVHRLLDGVGEREVAGTAAQLPACQQVEEVLGGE